VILNSIVQRSINPQVKSQIQSFAKYMCGVANRTHATVGMTDFFAGKILGAKF
jgi:hypothetical protein